MTNSVTFNTGNGSVTITQTGASTATILENGTLYNLANVVISGDTITCEVTDEPFVTPILTVVLKAGGLDDVSITISQSWVEDGTTVYPVTAADIDNLESFKKSF